MEANHSFTSMLGNTGDIGKGSDAHVMLAKSPFELDILLLPLSTNIIELAIIVNDDLANAC